MALFSYIITRDYGFAPNPFPPYCTLATCKPRIRRSAAIGDWVLEIGSAAKGSTMKERLIYAMQVQEKLTYDQYWNDPRFCYKRPIMNGSKKQTYGDNIYHTDQKASIFLQENSHHSLPDGSVNYDNYRRDLSSTNVLVSKRYWYWGKDAIKIPPQYHQIVKVGIGNSRVEDEPLISKVVLWFESMEGKGYIGEPFKFHDKFERYNGK